MKREISKLTRADINNTTIQFVLSIIILLSITAPQQTSSSSHQRCFANYYIKLTQYRYNQENPLMVQRHNNSPILIFALDQILA